MSLFEATFRPLINLIPFYYFQKIALIVYLTCFKGSALVYALIEPTLIQIEPHIDEILAKVMKRANAVVDATNAAAADNNDKDK